MHELYIIIMNNNYNNRNTGNNGNSRKSGTITVGNANDIQCDQLDVLRENNEQFAVNSAVETDDDVPKTTPLTQPAIVNHPELSSLDFSTRLPSISHAY